MSLLLPLSFKFFCDVDELSLKLCLLPVLSTYDPSLDNDFIDVTRALRCYDTIFESSRGSFSFGTYVLFF